MIHKTINKLLGGEKGKADLIVEICRRDEGWGAAKYIEGYNLRVKEECKLRVCEEAMFEAIEEWFCCVLYKNDKSFSDVWGSQFTQQNARSMARILASSTEKWIKKGECYGSL